ncbi:helix-turn-helix transcriptional regulator [Nocardia sp. SYP-A9097]|uniref:helix-turn-helix domain-containing protein n=1 Tax=Nocardia sp. SYP-A9097 TaxID=2663237 RepID=UPI001E434C6E|nr:helix-turn-helix transcriptional regulator [Nocardia sp. SYP-A9097]
MRDHREGAGKTKLAAGLHLDVSHQKIMRLESGQTVRISTPQIQALLDFYAVPPGEQERALKSWASAKAETKDGKGFWQAYADQYEPHMPHYLSLEANAGRVTTHQLVLVPGLLQTSDYKRAIVRIDDPELSIVDTERRVELTTRRQARLDDDSFRIDAYISEAVLRNQPGSPDVMSQQLYWLAEVGARPGINIRVIPFGVGPHRGLTILSFTLLEFPRLDSGLIEPPVVYLEGAFGALYHEQSDVLDLYRQAIDALGAVALTEDDTRDVLLRVAKEYSA